VDTNNNGANKGESVVTQYCIFLEHQGQTKRSGLPPNLRNVEQLKGFSSPSNPNIVTIQYILMSSALFQVFSFAHFPASVQLNFIPPPSKFISKRPMRLMGFSMNWRTFMTWSINPFFAFLTNALLPRPPDCCRLFGLHEQLVRNQLNA
jgi:hypothetical protein